MRKVINRTGEKYMTNEGYLIEIVSTTNYKKCSIKFEDGTIIHDVRYEHIKNGNVANPFHKSVLNIGFFGIGHHTARYKNGGITKAYNAWRGVIRRCYSVQNHAKHPTYKDCEVDERWHNFQVFAEWFYQNCENHMQNWALDKDILIKGNKTYSPETCCFVPQEINSIFSKSDSKRGEYPIGVGITKSGKYFTKIAKYSGNSNIISYHSTPEEAFESYKIAKESYIKEVADIWKDQIEPRVYQAMHNYKVEITD